MKLVASLKRCSRCKQSKPLADFAKAKHRKDGLQTWCRPCSAEHQKTNREGANARLKRWRVRNPHATSVYLRQARLDAIRHYSKTDPPSCACCGESEPAFLVIDHIAGGGNVERRAVGRRLYARLRKTGWPTGYQVLCWNCNAAKAYQGVCPHEANRREPAL